jgi:hypothetical protein
MPVFQSETDILKFLDQIDEESEAAKNDLNRRMEENLDQKNGKQWKGPQAPKFLFNVIGAALEDKTGKLAESKPEIAIMATRKGLEQPAAVLKKCISSVWDRRKIEYATERIAYYGAVAGAAFIGTPYNRRLNGGVGDIDFVVKDPRACGIDPGVSEAKDTDQGEYVWMEDFLPLDYIRNEYPGRGAEVKPSERISGYVKPRDNSTTSLLRRAYSMLNRGKAKDTASAIPRAIVREYYIQDRRESIDDLGTVPICKSLTKWKEKGVDGYTGAPFPGGRRILRAGEVLLEDSPNPYWDGAPPLDMLSWKVDLESAWGCDEIQGVRRMQEAVNRLGDAYTNTALINSTTRLVMDYGALSPQERNKLSNSIGEIIEKAPGREFNYQIPPQLPVEVVGFVNQLHDWIRQSLGVVIPPTQKDLPSIVTGPAMDSLQLMIETPIRTAARRIEEILQRVGQKMVARVFQYYTSDRILHLVGPDKKWIEFEFVRSQLIRDAKGRPRQGQDLVKAFQDFYFSIEPGSSLAVARTQKAMMAFQLVQAGLLHPIRVLQALGFPDPEGEMEKAKDAKSQGLIPDPSEGKNTGSQSMGQTGFAA